MTAEEKSAMKAACVQAAATLIAARDNGKGQLDVEECVTLNLRQGRYNRLARASITRRQISG
jgi:hypothetical protein